MTLRVTPSAPPRAPILRELVLESLDRLLESPWVIDPELPCEGGPILATDATRNIVVISYDALDSAAALLCGLAALDALQTHRQWLARLYPDALGDASAREPRLVVLGPTAPPAAARLSASNARIDFFRLRTLQINGEPGLLIEPCGLQQPAAPPEHEVFEPPPYRPPVPSDVPLSKEEEAFFQSL